jgi:hypothetical protein
MQWYHAQSCMFSIICDFVFRFICGFIQYTTVVKAFKFFDQNSKNLRITYCNTVQSTLYGKAYNDQILMSLKIEIIESPLFGP